MHIILAQTPDEDQTEPAKIEWCWSKIAIVWTPMVKWYVLRCGSKNDHQKGFMCLKEIGLRTQNTLTILD